MPIAHCIKIFFYENRNCKGEGGDGHGSLLDGKCPLPPPYPITMSPYFQGNHGRRSNCLGTRVLSPNDSLLKIITYHHEVSCCVLQKKICREHVKLSFFT